MNGHERHAHGGALEHALSYNAQEKGGTCVVAEEKGVLGLLPGEASLAMEAAHGLGAHGIPAHCAQEQRRCRCPGQVEEGLHPPPCRAAHGSGDAQAHPKLRENEEGKETGQQRPGAEIEGVPGGSGRRAGQEKQGKGAEEQPHSAQLGCKRFYVHPSHLKRNLCTPGQILAPTA